ncbi:MAG: hypothetical protein IKL10_07410 [Clostridia bacterium]|nr:hypothetical protein [Clostridia bacterium]
MKNFKVIIALTLAVIMCMSMTAIAFAATEDGSYVITNPYENINWETVTAYKTALHSHTNASDGDDTLKASVERHVEAGFDIVATTDHGTVNYSWADENVNTLIYGAMSLFGKSEGELEYLSTEGVFSNGTAYTYGTAANGDDYLTLDSGKKMLRVPYGIENNAVSVNAHVNSWFADYVDNTITTYEDAVKGVHKKGGVSVINHPGEYTKARYEIRSENAYNDENPVYNYYINKFATLIREYDSCIGIDMNSKGDNRTRFDRILWDNLLQRFSANGENVYAIASSDAHQLSVIDTGYTLALLEEQSSAALKNALLNGEFFAASHCLGNYDELVAIAASLKEFYGETELYNKVNTTALEMAAKIEGIENGEYAADEDIGITYSTLDDDGYNTSAADPRISSITVDEATDVITINTTDALIVRFISDGKLICTKKANEASLDLNEVSAELGDYVRVEVFGEGGIVYTQAFLLDAAENAGTADPVKGSYVNLGVLDFLFAEFNNWYAIIVRFFSTLF